jgi:pectinesterase
MITRIFAPSAAALLLAGCTTIATPAEHGFFVQKDCGAQARCFATIQSAVDAAQAVDPENFVTIEVGAGDFAEKVVIERANLALKGQGASVTRLHFDLVAQHAAQFHRDRWGTAGSATLTINSQNVAISGITIENTFDYLANDLLPADDPHKIGNSQALAVLLDIASDRVVFDRVALLGYQDTLFANGKRAFVRDSLIAGNVDFIFGNGQLLIEDSELRTRPRAAGAEDEGGFESYLIAPSTQIAEPIGIMVHRSRLTREDGVPDGSVALARPWHPTTRFADGRYADPNAIGLAIFVDCFMDAHVHPDHWAPMNGTARDGSKTDVFYPQDSRFWQSGSYGPGARHRDIGMQWQPDTSFDVLRTAFFANWRP